MFKILLLLFVACLSTDVIAAPSAKILGNNKNVNISDTKAITQKNQNNAIVAKTAKVSATKANITNSSRLPSVVSVKPKVNNIKQVTSSNITTIKPNKEDNSASTIQRIEALESRNEKTITDVVEIGSGSYVADIKVDGKNLVIKKTRLLQAPIRNKNGDDLNDTAEIWIIK